MPIKKTCINIWKALAEKIMYNDTVNGCSYEAGLHPVLCTSVL